MALVFYLEYGVYLVHGFYLSLFSWWLHMSFDLAFGNWGFTLCLRILTFTWAFSWHLKVSSWQLFLLGMGI